MSPSAAVSRTISRNSKQNIPKVKIIGEIRAYSSVSQQEQVVLETELGGERILEELQDDPLPRIC